jgi:hypothetical protein
MLKRSWSAALIVSVVFILIGSAFTSVFADTSAPAGNGLSISPLTTNIVINSGQTQIVPLYIKNVTGSEATIEVQIDDFTANSNETGQPLLLLNGETAPSHSLKNYIAPIENVNLSAGQQQEINVSISIPKNTPGGGYYGAVRFIPITTSSGKSITLTASVASLILVRVPGNVIDSLNLASFGVEQSSGSDQAIFFSNHNLQADIRFQNTGNVQEQPFGKAVLKDGNKEVGIYEINNTVPASNVLPGSIRKFTINLTNIGFIGKYTLEGNFGYGVSGQLVSGSTTFYVIPLSVIIIAIVIILLILIAIFVTPRLIRMHDRRVVRRSRI